MTFQDVASLLSAWLLGMFTQAMMNDSAAKDLCRMDLLELENTLEKLALQQNNPSRRTENDASKIEEIKQISRRLNVNQAELFIQIPALKNLIDQSCEYILSCKKNPKDSPNYIPFVGVNLHELWGNGIGRNYEATKIKEIRSLLDTRFIKRIWKRLNLISNIMKIACFLFSFIKKILTQK